MINVRRGFIMFGCEASAGGCLLQMHSTLIALIYVSLLATAEASLDYYSGSHSQQMCYSCMSTDKEETWGYLQHVYYKPKNFTNHCNRPMITYAMGVVPCTSVCVIITEMRVVSGHFAGYSFTRGCLHSIAKNGFRNTTLRDYHFELRPSCERLPRNAVFYKSNPTIEDQIYFCTCFGDRCNDDRNSAGVSYSYQIDAGFLLLALRSLVFPACLLFLWSSTMLVDDIRLRCS